MSLPTYLERGLREEKDTIDQFLAEFEKTIDRVQMEASTREQARSELLISKFADLSIELKKRKGKNVLFFVFSGIVFSTLAEYYY